MKNLTATFSHKWSLPPLADGIGAKELSNASSTCSAIAFNLDDDTFWACRETVLEDEVTVEILRGENAVNGSLQPFVTLPACPIAPFPTSQGFKQVLSIMHLPEEQSVCVIMAGGDIVLIKLEEVDGGLEPGSEIVGSFPPGLKSASWSPTQDLLVLINGDDALLVMTPTFEVVFEAPLRVDDQGEEVQINVGWGSKKTQFHGSLGKSAAAAADGAGERENQNVPIAKGDDDALPRISWRGDGLYFSISSLDPYASPDDSTTSSRSRRQLRVYSRNPIALSTTSEPVFGLDAPIAWRPSGNLIAGVQAFGPAGSGLEAGEGSERGRCDVVFFERNGLRHGEFRLREDRRREYTTVDLRAGARMPTWKVKGLSYNSESTVLAVWLERGDETDVVQLWTMNNYHHYLKAEWTPSVDKSVSGEEHSESRRFEAVVWHPERADELWLVTRDLVQRRRFAWETVVATASMPNDTGTVAVIDGNQILLTPFRTQNVPPPMSSYSIELPCTPVHMCIPPERDQLVALLPDGRVISWDLNTRLPRKGLRGGGAIARPVVCLETAPLDRSLESRQVSATANGDLAILTEDRILYYSAGSASVTILIESQNGSVGRIVPGHDRSWFTVSEDGETKREAPFTSSPDTTASCNAFSSYAFDVRTTSRWPDLLFGRTPSNRLYVTKADLTAEPVSLSSECTSMALTSEFLVWTTNSHDSKYAPLAAVQDLVMAPAAHSAGRTWESRRVERGSQIVTVVPSSMALVLKMPRGNLETVNPRPLVLEVVKKNVAVMDYRSAFVSCRRHRIDLNLLYDLAPEVFLCSIPTLVDQVSEVDYLNLLVSGLKNENVAVALYQQVCNAGPEMFADKVNTVCNAVRKELVKRDLLKYVETILTTHVCKTPPDLEAGLDVLRSLRVTHPDAVAEAIKYIIFLTDVNRLYNVALGMYDFHLVLLVAQYSQRDPKEYLPFLRELRALPKFYQRFRIDDHLERHDAALRNLSRAGEEHFEQAATYAQTHGLYFTAMEIYAEEAAKLGIVQGLYGDYLMETRDYMSAADLFRKSGETQKALDALERAHAWKELLALAKEVQLPEAEVSDRCDRLADYLASRGRQLEAAQVFLQYRDDVDQAVHVLCRGAKFTEANDLIAARSRPDLIVSEVYPGLDDANEQAIDLFEEVETQINKEVVRLAELDAKLDEDPDAFFMIETEPMMENVDVMTEATTAATGFTRFTAARSTMTGTSKNTAKSRRLGKKRAKGRKGTVDEFEYLLASLARLVERVEEKTAECDPLLFHLRETKSAECLGTATELEDKVVECRSKLRRSLDTAWEQHAKVNEARKLAFGEDEAMAALVAQHIQSEVVPPPREGSQVGPVDSDRIVVGEKPIVKAWPAGRVE